MVEPTQLHGNGHHPPPPQTSNLTMVIVTVVICATVAAVVWAIAWTIVSHRAIEARERGECWSHSDGSAISLITCGAQTDMRGRAAPE
jgi:hypothetical protein